jgi:hypothetical protein
MQFDKVAHLTEAAKRGGGRVLLGGDTPDKGLFFPLTLIADVDNGNPLVDEEQFGPVLPIIRYSDVSDVIERANDNPNGLGGSVWSKDVRKPRRLRFNCNAARPGSTSTGRSSRMRHSAASKARASVSNLARKVCLQTPTFRSCGRDRSIRTRPSMTWKRKRCAARQIFVRAQ